MRRYFTCTLTASGRFAATTAELQYGLWQLQDRSILWGVRASDGRRVQEATPVVSVGERRFVLREQDGSLTSFERLN